MRHALTPVRTLAVLAVLALSLLAAGNVIAQVPAVGATAEVRDANGRVVANAEFREGRGEVLITILFPNPPVLTGTHAVHINDTGRCDPPAFTTAGKIFNPLNKKHGRQNPEGAEVGDLPNVNFTTGLTSYNTTAVGATLGSGTTSLLSPNRSLVIYTNEDDQQTDPDGKVGAPIACGVIAAAANAPGAPAAQGNPPAAPKPTSNLTATATPTAVIAPGVPKIASPVPTQPAQSATKPGNPVVVQPPVVVKAATSPSPVVAAPAAAPTPPTPIIIPTTAPLTAAANPQPSAGGLNPLTALVIAVLGVGLVGAGYLLRRRSELQRRGG